MVDARLPWLSFHIAYHTGDRDRLLVDAVGPLVRRLLAEKRIDGFFFVRYSWGGPHIRLRLRPVAGGGEEVRERAWQDLADFLRRHPSPRAIPEEQIRARNRARGPVAGEPDDFVLADNTVGEIPFVAETERYGGPRLLAASLDYFASSSARALRLLARRAGIAQGDWLATALRLRARQALGFARHPGELEKLIAVPEPAGDPVGQRAEERCVREAPRASLLVRQEIEKLTERGSADEDTEAARRLAYRLRRASAAVRARVFSSHLHMTANRLGLRNVEEAYLARLLWRACQPTPAAAAVGTMDGPAATTRSRPSPFAR